MVIFINPDAFTLSMPSNEREVAIKVLDLVLESIMPTLGVVERAVLTSRMKSVRVEIMRSDTERRITIYRTLVKVKKILDEELI